MLVTVVRALTGVIAVVIVIIVVHVFVFAYVWERFKAQPVALSVVHYPSFACPWLCRVPYLPCFHAMSPHLFRTILCLVLNGSVANA